MVFTESVVYTEYCLIMQRIYFFGIMPLHSRVQFVRRIDNLLIYPVVTKHDFERCEGCAILLYQKVRCTRAQQSHIAKSLFLVQDKLQIASIGPCQIRSRTST